MSTTIQHHTVVTIGLLLLAGTPSPSQSPSSSLYVPEGACVAATDYQLGSNDQISVLVVDLESDFSGKNFTINGNGDLALPHVGSIHAAGLSTTELENQVRVRLTRILKAPQVIVGITAFRSQPVSILGAVNNPGMREIQTGKTLFDVLSLAGGLRPDAGYLVHITRSTHCGPIPLPGAQIDSTGRFSIASVKVKDILGATHPSENIPVFPGDAISVPKAEVVYAVGCVTKPGGFLLNEHESLSALQVLSLAEGLQRTAASRRAKILRSSDGSPTRAEIPVDLKLLMAGKTVDVQLRAGDILFVPNSNAKSTGYRTLDTVTGMAGAALIYTH